MPYNKKAVGWNDIKTIALVLFILLITIFIYNNVIRDATSGLDECKGACKPACGAFEMQYSSKCYKGGELQEDMVCCTGSPEDNDDSDNDAENDENINLDDLIDNGEEEQQIIPPRVSVTYGEADAKSPLLPVYGFKVGYEYNIQIKSQGTNVDSCKVFFLKGDTRRKIDEGTFKESFETQGNCDKEISITPTEKDKEILETVPPHAILIITLELEDQDVYTHSDYVLILR